MSYKLDYKQIARIERGYLDKSEILKYVSEEDIFELVFEEKPHVGKLYTSPFREDRNAGCWFEYYKGKLWFIDFGSGGRTHMDCFNAASHYFGTSNFQDTIQTLYEFFISGNEDTMIPLKRQSSIARAQIQETIIRTETREFEQRDRRYWQPYGISSKNLNDDEIFPVKRVHMTTAKKGTWVFSPYKACYALSGFEQERKKIYTPFQKGKGKFITNCKADDIGGLKTLDASVEHLIISKSYKDCRVLRNCGYQSVWFQNEGMFPCKEKLKCLCDRAKRITVFFDNDLPGISASDKLTRIINKEFGNKAMAYSIPMGLEKDPADVRRLRGEHFLGNLLHENLR